MASSKQDKAALAQEMKKKTITIDDSVFYALLKDRITLAAARRCIANDGGEGVGAWRGTVEEFDEHYNDRCIEQLPVHMLD